MATLPPTPPESHMQPTRVEAVAPVPYSYQESGHHSGDGDPRRMIRRLITAVLRHRWAVLALTILGTGVGYGAGRFIKPIYRAQASVWVETGPEQGGRDRGPIRPAQLLGSFGWVELLKSFVVLDEVVLEQRLYLSFGEGADSSLFASFRLAERFAPGKYRLEVRADGTFQLQAGKAPVQDGRAGDSIGTSVGLLWQPSPEQLRGPRTIEFRVTTPREAAQKLAQDLIPGMDANGTFLRVALEGTDPHRLASSVNGIVERHVAVAADLKREKLTELTKILSEQLQYAARNLAQAERALESYRVQIITQPREEQSPPMSSGLQQTRDPVFSTYFDINVRREQLRRDRDAIERALAGAGGGSVSPDALNVIGEVAQSTELRSALTELVTKQAEVRSLRYRYSDAHPLVRQRVAEVDTLDRQTIPALARQLVAQIGTREAELSNRVSAASRELQQIPPRAMEEARLSREKMIAENLYTTLQSRFEEARLAEASSIPDIRVLERAAVPQFPITNNALRMILIGFAGGLGLAIAGALILDRLDPRLRYPEQVTAGMGLSILGAVPHVRKNGKSKTDTQHVLEALRGVRLNLIHAYGAAGPVVVTVTSPGSGDGKSFLSSNLALCFADNGARTLLIDGDVRRGRLHALMNVTRKPGLTDLLAGEATRDKIIHQTNYPFLSVIASGTRRQNGPELLGSPAMAQLMATLRSSYDVILVDSPPLGAGVDPFVLGTLTGHMLLVLRTGVTDRQYTEAKLDMLDRLPVRLLGAVLNDVRAGDAYGYYAYYHYLPGYEATDERVGETARQLPGND